MLRLDEYVFHIIKKDKFLWYNKYVKKISKPY